MPRKRIDLTGKVFGKLTAIEYAGHQGNHAMWKCKCECGEESTVRKTSLTSGKTKSCGCLKGAPKDLTGQVFGKLTAIEYAGLSKWKCKCECGGESTVQTARLMSGHTKSCGCLKTYREKPAKDLTGQVFGRLTAIEYVGSKKNVGYWKCKCECGEVKEIRAVLLTNGTTQSCGCLHREKFRQKALDLTGQVFGRLTVIELSEKKDHSRLNYWKCKCDCGEIVDVKSTQLSSGVTKSCGCYNKDVVSKMKKTHGMSTSPLYRVWRTMISRCQNKNSTSYKRYGARGIKVCDEWQTFEGFFKDMGSGYESGLTIERKDYDGNYEPSNCKWATPVEQGNNKSNNHRITVFGEELTLAEASRKYKIAYATLKARIRKGWNHEEAVTAPIQKGGRKRK